MSYCIRRMLGDLEKEIETGDNGNIEDMLCMIG